MSWLDKFKSKTKEEEGDFDWFTSHRAFEAAVAMREAKQRQAKAKAKAHAEWSSKNLPPVVVTSVGSTTTVIGGGGFDSCFAYDFDQDRQEYIVAGVPISGIIAMNKLFIDLGLEATAANVEVIKEFIKEAKV